MKKGRDGIASSLMPPVYRTVMPRLEAGLRPIPAVR